jgi:hypothetical protein
VQLFSLFSHRTHQAVNEWLGRQRLAGTHLRTSTWRPFSEGRPSSQKRSPLAAKLTAPSFLVCSTGDRL